MPTLQAGTRLGPYEVVRPIGSGGMGEVYRARDARLNRDVAIKVLPEIFLHEPERLSRFEREAKTLASLNHPNIAQIYGVEEAGPSAGSGQAAVLALVMELVDGPTLADRIAHGPLPLDEALPIARQIADALEAAHERGIIHRDLKPANIKVRSDGTVKVLDFGLAKSSEPREASGAALGDSPTSTGPATRNGIILGTAAYMAPEQVRGKAVDKRADIWAFGVVLFEMLTGRLMFEGETVADVLAAVVTRDPDWKRLPPATPAGVRRLLRRCLERDPARRLRDIGDARADLDDAISGVDVTPASGLGAASSSRQLWPWALTSILLVALAVILWRYFNASATVPLRTTRLSVVTQPLAVTVHAGSPVVALSPDGTHLAYVAGDTGVGQLYLRKLNSLEARPIAGAEHVQGPFFSPDGQEIAFFNQGALQRISLRGGPPVNVCVLPEVGPVHGGSWGDDGTIVFEEGGRLSRVSAEGGTPKPIITPGSFYFPEILPGSKAIVLTTGVPEQRRGIWALSLETGRLRQLVEEGGIARYTRSGHLVYASQGSLLAAPFDLDKLQLTGPAVPVIQNAMMGLPEEPLIAHLAVSHTGTLAYLPGPVLGELLIPVWVNRDGQEERLAVEPRRYEWPRLSPDGSRLALAISQPGSASAGAPGDVWIYDLARQTLARLTSDPAHDGRPLWTPDGRRVVFRSLRDGPGQFNLFWKAADGTGPDERLTTNPNRDRTPWSFSPDGKRLVFNEPSETGYDLHVLLLEGQRPSRPLMQTPFFEGSPVISPDGRWIAYRSTETGRFEIYVRPFPNADTGRWPISTNGGSSPLWSPDGRELFYQKGEAMMVVAVNTTGGFAAGTPKVLFTGKYVAGSARNFDIAPNGRRFMMIKDAGPTLEASARDELTVVLNWFEELRQLVPAAK